jgi:hypothetical protein
MHVLVMVAKRRNPALREDADDEPQDRNPPRLGGEEHREVRREVGGDDDVDHDDDAPAAHQSRDLDLQGLGNLE